MIKKHIECHVAEPKTCRAWIAKYKPSAILETATGGVVGCPSSYMGNTTKGCLYDGKDDSVCRQCWNQPVPEDYR